MMAEDHWQPARLIPTNGISGQDEAERRATSALLSVIGAVREFGAAIVRPLGAPAGHIDSYIEVPFKLGEREVIPDGLLQTARGSRAWTAVVEVKTGSAELRQDQIEGYLDMAREQGFDVVLTISNQIAPAPGVHPVVVDKRKLRKVALAHLSWAEVLTLAVTQRVHRGVSDLDQAWILGELIRYLEHPKSGALDFADMGSAWVPTREAVLAGTLRPGDPGLAQVVSRWEQLLRFAALRLGRELGAQVHVILSRKESADPSILLAAQAQSLVTNGILTGELRISDTVAPLAVTADLRAGRVTVSVDIDAPREGRPATRVNWLLRQLGEAPDNVRIDAFATGSRGTTSELLHAVRTNPKVLAQDPTHELRMFRISAMSPMGTKRGTGRGSFIDSVLATIDGFYAQVLQQVRSWTPHAPQLPKSGKTAAEEAGLDLVPPPSDLLEDTTDDTTTFPPADESSEAMTESVGTGLSPTEELSVTPADEGALVTWDDAHERLDYERSRTTLVPEDADTD
jgi:hypothetical protein